MRRFLPFLLAAILLLSCQKEPSADSSLREGAVHVTVINIAGKIASYDSESGTYVATLPAVTDFSSLKVNFATEAALIQAQGKTLSKSDNELDLTEPLTVRFILNGVYQDYTIAVRNTGLPVVRIETPGRKTVSSKEYWMPGATLRIEYPDGTVDYEGTTEIRGRGNSTWSWYPMKPYALRLQEKGEILGMPSHKRWILLANWKDRTLMRNDAAFWLSAHSGLPYTVRGQFVELVMNGLHVGNYYLCEQIKLNKKRIDIEKMDPMETDPVKITGGFLLELDTYFDEKYQFKYDKLFNLPWMVKEPDDDELSDAAFQYIKGWIKDLETLLKDDARVQAHEYEEYLDVDTAIDYLIVEELTGNHDFYNEWPWNGPHSVYMYKERGGKLYHGPVWDFDYHVFIPNRSQQWAGAKKTLFYPALLKDEKFRKRLVERWEAQKDALKELPAHIDETADHIRLSESINHAMWPILEEINHNENGDVNMTFQEAVERIKRAFLAKWEWMDRNIAKLSL